MVNEQFLRTRASQVLIAIASSVAEHLLTTMTDLPLRADRAT